jgi:hypothetical protein
MPGNDAAREAELKCATDEEIMDQLMKHMPPVQ